MGSAVPQKNILMLESLLKGICLLLPGQFQDSEVISEGGTVSLSRKHHTPCLIFP